MAKTVGAILLSTLVTLALFEAGLRVYHSVKVSRAVIPEKGNATKLKAPYRTEGLSYGSQDNFAQMSFDPFLGYSPKKSFKGRGYYINNLGYRYPRDVVRKKLANEVRIFVLGGSFAFGAGVPDGFTYNEIAEKELSRARPGKNFVVLNGGVGAYVGYQEYFKLLNSVMRLEPDIVLFVSGWNDVYRGLIGLSPFDGNNRMKYDAAIEASYSGKIIPVSDYKNAFVDGAHPPLWYNYRVKLTWLFDKFFYKFRSQRDVAKKHFKTSVGELNLIKGMVKLIRLIAYAGNSENLKMAYVLQPSLYNTQKPLHTYEKKLLDSYNKRFPKAMSYFGKSYELINIDLKREINSQKILYFDSDDSLKLQSNENAFFVDHVHFGEIGQNWFGKYLANEVLLKMVN